jgi:hypothetical protein
LPEGKNYRSEMIAKKPMPNLPVLTAPGESMD